MQKLNRGCLNYRLLENEDETAFFIAINVNRLADRKILFEIKTLIGNIKNFS